MLSFSLDQNENLLCRLYNLVTLKITGAKSFDISMQKTKIQYSSKPTKPTVLQFINSSVYSSTVKHLKRITKPPHRNKNVSNKGSFI